MSHTPGPWAFESDPFIRVDPAYTLRIYATDPGPLNAYTIGFVYDVDEPTRTAHARLFAAAPELLEALKEVVNDINDPDDFTSKKYSYIISKATGGDM